LLASTKMECYKKQQIAHKTTVDDKRRFERIIREILATCMKESLTRQILENIRNGIPICFVCIIFKTYVATVVIDK